MRRILQASVGQLDAVYRHQPFFVGRKARLLAAFDLLLLVLIPLNLLKLAWLQPPELGFRIVFNASIWIAALVSLIWVRSGRLQSAGSGLVLIAAVPTHILLFLAPRYVEPVSVAVQLLISDLVFLLIALVFAPRRVAVVVLAIVVASQLAFYFLALHADPIPGTLRFAANIAVRDGFIVVGLVFCLGFALDEILTAAHRHSEEALRETRLVNENLERLVTERTRELEIATARANDASRAKGEFLANMSHELRTPLNGVVAASELLLIQPGLPREAAEHARLISDSGELLLRLIGNVLDLSKIEAGQLELEEQPFSMPALVRDCTGLLAARASQCGVQLEGTLAPPLEGDFLGDGFRLRQILLNLISNAIKFTPAGGSVTLRVFCGESEARPMVVRFEVRDTGIGMDEATRQKLFRRFAQGDSSTSRRYGGAGLGLAISFGLVELMGGQLEVASEPGRGSTFQFAIPLPVSNTAVARPVVHDPSPQLGLRVLVVEDNAVNRKILGAQLEKFGCLYTMAVDGSEALLALEAEPLPDVILMDCDMPKIDGWEAARRIRAWHSDDGASPLQKRAAALTIIALTAAMLPEERARCFEVGMNDYLTKPIKLAGLGQVLQTVPRLDPVVLAS